MASETIANGTTEIVHRLDLDEYGLADVPNEDKEQAKIEVAQFLENEVLREVNRGVSPVQGEGRFKRLDTEYAIKVKNGTRLSNLEHEGDLLESFKVKSDKGAYLEVGHTGSQTPKADGHNQLSSKAKSWAKAIGYPRRRYIPDQTQKYVPKITNEIKDIISEYIPSEAETVDATPITSGSTESTTEEIAPEIKVDTTNMFSDDVIDALLAQALRRRNVI